MRKTRKKLGKSKAQPGQVGVRFRGLARAAEWDSGSMILRWTAARVLERRSLPQLPVIAPFTDCRPCFTLVR